MRFYYHKRRDVFNTINIIILIYMQLIYETASILNAYAVLHSLFFSC